MTSLQERVESVREAIAQAAARSGRSAEEITLVSVSKRQDDRLLAQAVELGLADFGENYVQELVRKQALYPKARFHMIGHVQTNKAKLLKDCWMMHTLDSEKLGKALHKVATEAEPLSALIEINQGAEENKAGVLPQAAEALIEQLQSMPWLAVRGLMSIPPIGEGRRWFAELRGLAERLRPRVGLSLPELSMGMSADFPEAIEEGATIVRVGTRIFGPRAT